LDGTTREIHELDVKKVHFKPTLEYSHLRETAMQRYQAAGDPEMKDLN